MLTSSNAFQGKNFINKLMLNGHKPGLCLSFLRKTTGTPLKSEMEVNILVGALYEYIILDYTGLA